MGGPEAQSGTLRGELEIGPKLGPPGPPEAPLRPSQQPTFPINFLHVSLSKIVTSSRPKGLGSRLARGENFRENRTTERPKIWHP